MAENRFDPRDIGPYYNSRISCYHVGREFVTMKDGSVGLKIEIVPYHITEDGKLVGWDMGNPELGASIDMIAGIDHNKITDSLSCHLGAILAVGGLQGKKALDEFICKYGEKPK